MFTGLIAATAALVKLEKKNRPVLTIRSVLEKPLAVGDSLAVNGVCLTLIEKSGDLLRFNLAVPTLRLSNLGDLPAGALLNIEFPVAADGLLGGHLSAATSTAPCACAPSTREIRIRTSSFHSATAIGKNSLSCADPSP